MRRAALTAWLALATAPALAQPAGEPLLWTRDPVRVDRARQALPRVPDKVPADSSDSGRLILRIPRPPDVRDSTGFAVGGAAYRIAEVAEVTAGRVCTGARGQRWACGLRARVALAELIRGRTLSCLPVEAEPAGAAGGSTGAVRLVDCRIGERSLAVEMVRAGWATPLSPGGVLAREADAARAARRGIHGDGPTAED